MSSSDQQSNVELPTVDGTRGGSVSVSESPDEVHFHLGTALQLDDPANKTNGHAPHPDINGANSKDGKEQAPEAEKLVKSTDAEKGAGNDAGEAGVGAEKKEEKAEEKPKVTISELFRYATTWDWFLMIVGGIAAIANGFALPAFSLILGGLLNSFSNNGTTDNIVSTISQYSLYFVYVAIGALVASWMELALFMVAAENQAKKVREQFLQSILRQEPAYLEAMKAGDFMQRLTEGTKNYQEALGEKFNNLLHHGSTFFSGIIIGLVKGWQLALIVLACTPLLAVCGAIMAKMLSGLSTAGAKAYSGAGGVASEVLGQLRTVIAFSGEDHEQKRYDEKLIDAEKAGIKKSVVQGLNMGVTMLVVFGTYALALWFGGKLIADKTTNPTSGDPYNGGDVTTVFFAVIMGAFSLGNLAPNVPGVVKGQVAAHDLYAIIDRKSKIDPLSKEGIKIEKKGADAKVGIEFRNVTFSYPSRANIQILRNFSLTIDSGKTVALCGSSGCGKSTIVSLLERFYDAQEGEILIDGNRLTDMNVSHWRGQIGMVRQEPALFSTTIEENIRYGNPAATFEEVVAAAKAANIHDTIESLPNKYKTNVGEEGRMLSGGQKQRVAIARAIIRDPLLLILDEATSALDSENERIVQAQLDQIMKQRQRTTIIIAHRLSTIRNADVIVCMHQGQIVEMGKHDELIAKRGAYFQLVQKQEDILQRGTTGDADEKTATLKRELSSRAVTRSVDLTDEANSADSDSRASNDESPSPEKNNAKEKEGTTTDEKKDEIDRKQPPPELPPGTMKRLFYLTRPDWGWFALGVIGACGHGLVFPGFSQILSNMISAFYLTDVDEMRREIAKWAWIFFAIGVGTFIMATLQFACIGITGERLTKRLRSMLMAKFLALHMGFYDAEENKSGVLITKLANEAADVQSIITGPAAQLFQVAALMASGLVFAFVYGWKLALVVLATAPLMVIAGWLQMKFVGGFSSKAKDAVEKAGQVANESIQNLKTVASFGAEGALLGRFTEILVLNRQAGIRRAHFTGVGFGASQFILFASYGLAFWYGGQLVQNGEMTLGDVLRVFFAIVMAAMGAGQSAQLAPDYHKANAAVIEIFRLLDVKVELTSVATDAKPAEMKEGELVFSNVSFAYPSRPDQLVLEGFNLRVPPHSTTALVGSSGSGKSTIVQLLERFYEPKSGSIALDGTDIRSISLQHYRRQLGFVQQEPVLFHGTLGENLRYGAWDSSEAQVLKAAQDANIHNFIQTLPAKYETPVGAKGLDLSGGQKQRCAIARAIVRQPKVLLLDEATSALDAESEAQVEAAIRDVQQKNRCTTIVIAHRLQTVKHADQIVVLEKGKIVEGPAKHEQLLAANGRYAALWHAQQKKGARST